MPDVRNALLFNPDNTFDLGASGATRPRNLFLAGAATVPNLTVSSTLSLPNGSVSGPALASGAALANLNQGDIAQVLGSLNITTDKWNNVALAAGDNGIAGGSLSVTIPDATDLVFINATAMAMIVNPSAAVLAGWRVFLDGGLTRRTTLTYCSLSITTGVCWSGTLLIGGPSTLAGAISSGAHSFELRFYVGASLSAGGYLLCASAPDTYQYKLEVWVLRR